MKTIRNYIFWAYERGSLHYDVMVTAILLFIFVGPRFIDFKDKPVTVPLHSSEVLVRSASANAVFTYEIRADDLGPVTTDADRRAALLRIIEPIAGEVTLESYAPVVDAHGHTIAFDATVRH
jgi:hypothetical protein